MYSVLCIVYYLFLVLSTLYYKLVFLLLELWFLTSSHNTQQLILKSSWCDHKVHQTHLQYSNGVECMSR